MLRDYQLADVERLREAIRNGHTRVLYQLPVGGGKTVVMSEIIRSAKAKGKTILFIAHRRELIWQTRDKLNRLGIEPKIVMGNTHIPLHDPQVWVATIQSVTSKRRFSQLPDFDLIVFDEAHRSVAPSYEKLARRYPNAVILGMTATPVRKDNKGLGNLYSTIVQGPTIPELIQSNYLVQPIYYAPSTPDLRGLQISNGDYREEDLERVMAPLVGDAVEWWLRLAKGRKTIVFASSVKHSQQLAKAFASAGIPSAHVDGGTPTAERDAIFETFRNSDEINVLVNCEVAVEGTDIPETSCIVVCRPTRSLVRWIQMIGRGLRVAPGINKQDCIVIDHSTNVYRLGFAESWNEWKLTKSYQEEIEEKTKEKKERTVKCPHCSAILTKENIVKTPDGVVCAFCMQPLPRRIGRIQIEHIDGQPALILYDGRAQPVQGVDRLTFYRELKWIAEQAGYKPGWAAHHFKSKFGQWPPYEWRNYPSMPPSRLTNYLARKIVRRPSDEQNLQARNP